MKTFKRDGQERAFNNGYKAAFFGKSYTLCPHEQENLRFQWMAGWREGRQDVASGKASFAGIHKSH